MPKLDYLPPGSAIPDELPSGKILVHNHVRPAQRQGERGFRFWLAQPEERYLRCDCGWAPELPEHWVDREE
jgi:hypothetical protein